MTYKSDIEIAQVCEMRKITEIAEIAGEDEKCLELYGNYKAKVDYALLRDQAGKPDGKLVLVTAINPTPAGEGKTQYSFSDDHHFLGALSGFTITVRNLKVSAGAGFIVALTGDIMTMPGLPSR